MKRTLMGLVLVALLTAPAAVATASAATPRVDRREVRQHQRVRQGVQSGRLTPREAARLRAGQARVHALEHLAKADGVVTPAERVRIARAQNRESRHIFRLKHNPRSL